MSLWSLTHSVKKPPLLSEQTTIPDVTIDGQDYILINLYNANTESEQLEVMHQLALMLEELDINQEYKVRSNGWEPCIVKLVEIKDCFELCDIWRIQNCSLQRYTFRRKYFSGLIQWRIGYIFLSNSLQEFISTIDILPDLSTDHSSVTFTVAKPLIFAKGSGFWKFNSSLINDEIYVSKMK